MRRARVAPLTGLLSVAVLSATVGCAGVQDVTGMATRDDLVQMQGEIASLQQAVHRARAEAESRVQQQTSESQRRDTNLEARISDVAATLSQLTARIDDLGARVDALARQPTMAPPPPAPQASPLPSGTVTPPETARPVSPAPAPATPPGSAPGGLLGAPATATPVTPPTGTPPTATPVPPPATASVPPPQPQPSAPPPAMRSAPATTGSLPPSPGSTPATTGSAPPTTTALQPQDVYQAAYMDFSKGSYPLAIAGFGEFLRRFPEHGFADNAQYWIAESHVGLARTHANAGQVDKATAELEQAVQEFRKVLANYPRGDKAPTALYKEALALLELRQSQAAESRLQYLVENFPQAAETPLARERLSALRAR